MSSVVVAELSLCLNWLPRTLCLPPPLPVRLFVGEPVWTPYNRVDPVGPAVEGARRSYAELLAKFEASAA